MRTLHWKETSKKMKPWLLMFWGRGGINNCWCHMATEIGINTALLPDHIFTSHPPLCGIHPIAISMRVFTPLLFYSIWFVWFLFLDLCSWFFLPFDVIDFLSGMRWFVPLVLWSRSTTQNFRENGFHTGIEDSQFSRNLVPVCVILYSHIWSEFCIADRARLKLLRPRWLNK